MTPGITVVIPNWNRRDLLTKLLDSLREQSHPIDEVIVVDNGSTDGSAAIAEASGARVIRLDDNRGFSKAVNSGIAAGQTTLVAVINNDVELSPDWLSRLAEALEDPSTWFATGKILSAVRPGCIDGAFDLPAKSACAWRAGSERTDSEVWNHGKSIHFTSFTAALFRTELFVRVGPLDERFGSYLEDVDFCLRATLHGYQGRYVPEAVARHYGSATLGAWSAAMVRLISRNQTLLIAAHYPSRLILSYAWRILIGQLLWGALALRKGAGLAWIQGKWEGLRLFRAMRKKRAPVSSQQLDSILSESERQIHELQQATGFDWFWRAYFALT